jgi:hypothetical protein
MFIVNDGVALGTNVRMLGFELHIGQSKDKEDMQPITVVEKPDKLKVYPPELTI